MAFLWQIEWSETDGVSFARRKCRRIRRQGCRLGVFGWGNKLHFSQLALAHLFIGLTAPYEEAEPQILGAIGALS